MSLKEFTKEVFTRYGLTEDDIKVYLMYLRTPRATISEAYLSFEEGEIEYARVEQITNMLVEKGFLKRISGIVDRFIPLEPYFELFTNESELFRNEIAKIKDNVLADQSNRFDRLENIQNNSIQEVENAVKTQVTDFFADSDNKNTSKKERIDKATTRFADTSKALEANLHGIHDNLNSELKKISQSFVNDNETEIKRAKDDLTKLIGDLLSDFSKRITDLERELKKDLDGHVDRHKNIANELKPKMEQILEKYLERMDKVVTDLKKRISNLLNEHINHVKSTTGRIESDIHLKVDDRHLKLRDQINSYRDRALTLLENLLNTSNMFSDFSEDITKQGLFFTKGKKRKFIDRWDRIKNEVASISRPFKDDFINDCNNHIRVTQSTVEELKTEVTNGIAKENTSLATETADLDKRAQDEISAELETLATDMSGEIDNTLQGGVKDCKDTSIKLKDSLENNLKQHNKQYDEAINRHNDDSQKYYNKFDEEIKLKNENWTKDVETKFVNGKQDCSEKIDAEIKLWNEESADMDDMLVNMLEDHKNKYQSNAGTLQNNLSTTTRDTIQNVKDAIADFTLQFMNSIDDATELAETNEGKLKDIHTASSSIQEISAVTTWHTIGRDALIAAIKDAVYRTKSSIIIVTPVVLPEILQVLSEFAYQRKAARFMLTSHWDMQAYGDIVKKMMQLGNIQFRNLTSAGEYFAVTRDAEEVILAPYAEQDTEVISIVSNHPAYAKLYSQFIGPIFQANSRPIKL
jgi:sugar-specific transcriptional regulator TrmB